jgi:hypothetical protein
LGSGGGKNDAPGNLMFGGAGFSLVPNAGNGEGQDFFDDDKPLPIFIRKRVFVSPLGAADRK